jgi:hypothetical protein
MKALGNPCIRKRNGPSQCRIVHRALGGSLSHSVLTRGIMVVLAAPVDTAANIDVGKGTDTRRCRHRNSGTHTKATDLDKSPTLTHKSFNQITSVFFSQREDKSRTCRRERAREVRPASMLHGFCCIFHPQPRPLFRRYQTPKASPQCIGPLRRALAYQSCPLNTIFSD